MTYNLTWEHENKKHQVSLELLDSVKVVEHFIIGDAETEVQAIVEKPKKAQAKKQGCASCGAKGLRNLIVGGAKLLKSELGIDACDEATIIDRRNLCESCEHYDFGVCDKCGCFCAAKVKLKSETCPVGRW